MDNQSPSSSPQTGEQPKDQFGNNFELWGRMRLGFLILVIFLGTVFLRACKNEKPKNPINEIKVKVPIKTISKETNKTNSTKYIPPEGSVTIIPKDPTKSLEDVVKIHYKEMGFTFEPGIECSGNLYFTCGVDAKLFFAYRFGIGGGIVAGNNALFFVSPDIFISYRLDQINLRNTEFILTYVPATKIPFGAGLRLNF